MNDDKGNIKNHEFERLVRSKLEHHEADVPVELWAQIQNNIPQRRISRTMWQYGAALAAIFIGAVVIFSSLSDKPSISIPEDLQSKSTVPSIENSLYANTSEKSEPHIALATTKPEYVEIIEKQIVHSNGNAETETKTVTEKKENTDNNDKKVKKQQTKKDNSYTYSKSDYTSNLFNKRKKKSRDLVTVGLLASNIQTSSSGSMGKQYFMRDYKQLSLLAAAAAEPQEKKYTHHMPITFGLTIGKTFASRIGFESGVTYSLLRSSYTAGEYKGKQQLHYIGIPLYMTYRFAEWKRFSFYVAAGGKIDFCVSGKSDEMDGEQTLSSNMNLTTNHARSIKDNPQFSLSAKAGISYPIVSKLELYAEPTLGYYFDNNSDIQNYWKDKPLGFSLQIGLRANF